MTVDSLVCQAKYQSYVNLLRCVYSDWNQPFEAHKKGKGGGREVNTTGINPLPCPLTFLSAPRFSLYESWQNHGENEHRSQRVLTGTQLSFEAQAVEVVAFAVFAPDLAELLWVAGALSAQTVASPAADRAARLRDAVDVIRRAVVPGRALTPRAQPARVTLTHATLVGPVAVATEGTVGFGVCLAVAAAGEIHRDLQGILKAQRFDGESVALLFGAGSQLSLHTERHLRTSTRLCDKVLGYQMYMLASLMIHTVSPILRPEQDFSPGTTSPFKQVALKERFNSSGTPSNSSWTLERIFCPKSSQTVKLCHILTSLGPFHLLSP